MLALVLIVAMGIGLFYWAEGARLKLSAMIANRQWWKLWLTGGVISASWASMAILWY